MWHDGTVSVLIKWHALWLLTCFPITLHIVLRPSGHLSFFSISQNQLFLPTSSCCCCNITSSSSLNWITEYLDTDRAEYMCGKSLCSNRRMAADFTKQFEYKGLAGTKLTSTPVSRRQIIRIYKNWLWHFTGLQVSHRMRIVLVKVNFNTGQESGESYTSWLPNSCSTRELLAYSLMQYVYFATKIYLFCSARGCLASSYSLMQYVYFATKIYLFCSARGFLACSLMQYVYFATKIYLFCSARGFLACSLVQYVYFATMI